MIETARKARSKRLLFSFASEENWFDYQFETDPRFERGIEAARQHLREGRATKLEDIDAEN